MSRPLNEALRLSRRAKGLTQEQLAQILHVSRQTISNWENGRANPDYELLKQLSETLETPLSALLGVDEPAPPEAGPSPEAGSSPEAGISPEATPLSASKAPPFRRRWLTLLLCSICAVAALAGVLARRANRQPPIIPSPYPMEWFEQETARVEGQAHVRMRVLQKPVKRTGVNSDTCYSWKYRLQLCEQGGVGFTISQLQAYYFHANGHHHVVTTSGEKLKNDIGTNELRANAVRSLACQDQSMQSFLGVGYLLEGVDANGNLLSFRCYVPYSNEIAQPQ